MAIHNWTPVPVSVVNPMKSGALGFIIGGGLTLVAVITAIGFRALSFNFLWLIIIPMFSFVGGAVYGMIKTLNSVPLFQDDQSYQYRVVLETSDGELSVFKRSFVGHEVMQVNDWIDTTEARDHESIYVFVSGFNANQKEVRLAKAESGICPSYDAAQFTTVSTA